MSEKPVSNRGWWQTLPGILTGLAAIITAVTGLIVAFNHDGSRSGQAGTASSQSASGSATRGSGPQSQSADAAGGSGAQSISLPALNRVRLGGGDAVITILSAQIEPIDAGRRSLKFVGR